MVNTSSQNQQLVLCPPAKINLILRVGGCLPNGYHPLWSLMQTIGLTDELTLSLAGSFSGVRFEHEGLNLGDPRENLVYQAATLVLEKTQSVVGVNISLRKQIPVAAGLGGGSSDAAATILGLNQLLGSRLSLTEMICLGAEIGSDVPFFFAAPTAVIQGMGEQVAPVILSGHRWILLINPGFPIKTKLAYQRLDEVRGTGFHSILDGNGLNGLGSFSWEEIVPLIKNDFEDVLLEDYPDLAYIKGVLLAAGAEASLVSGSGASVFGVFSDESEAQQAKALLVPKPTWEVFVVPAKSQGLLSENGS